MEKRKRVEKTEKNGGRNRKDESELMNENTQMKVTRPGVDAEP